MAVGINTDKISNIKIDLLTYIEKVNSLYVDFDNVRQSILSSIEGPGKEIITSQLMSLSDELVKVKDVFDSYITVLNQVVKSYEQSDSDLSLDLQNSIDDLKKEV